MRAIKRLDFLQAAFGVRAHQAPRGIAVEQVRHGRPPSLVVRQHHLDARCALVLPVGVVMVQVVVAVGWEERPQQALGTQGHALLRGLCGCDWGSNGEEQRRKEDEAEDKAGRTCRQTALYRESLPACGCVVRRGRVVVGGWGAGRAEFGDYCDLPVFSFPFRPPHPPYLKPQAKT